MVVHGHEGCVHDNTQSDEELHERIEHEQVNKFRKLDPYPATIPDTEDVHHFLQKFNCFFLEFFLKGFFLLFCGEIIDGNYKMR